MLGPIVCGSDVFDPNRLGFVFVSSGFSGSLILAFCHGGGLSEAIAAAVVISTVPLFAASACITSLQAVLFSIGLNIPSLCWRSSLSGNSSGSERSQSSS